jgi:hypothetical protein
MRIRFATKIPIPSAFPSRSTLPPHWSPLEHFMRPRRVLLRFGSLLRRLQIGAALAGSLLLAACANGDFGRIKPSLVHDDMHAWVGTRAARSAGIAPSNYPLTDDERQLRDLAYPLIEPPYDRQRWYSIVGEYGLTHIFHCGCDFDATAYERVLNSTWYRSATGRYARLNDDIRNDVVRVPAFFSVARRVLDMDRKREKSLAYVSGLTAEELTDAVQRVAENSLVIGWVQQSLVNRAASYRYALERLVIATPTPIAVETERSLTLLQTRIAENQILPGPALAPGPFAPVPPPPFPAKVASK